MIRALANPAYLEQVLRLAARARRSIVLVTYLAELSGRRGDPVLRVARALIGARRRGVRVSVILEGSRFENNYPFYRLLKRAGADAWLDTSRTLIHQKAFLFDGRVLVAGSHNLAAASLEHSEELSLATDDPGAVAVFRRALGTVTRQRDDVRAGREKDLLRLPPDFLARVAAPLYRAHAEDAFDLYLMLCDEDGGRPRPIAIDAKRWGRALGFDPGKAGRGCTERYRRYYYAQRMNRLLGQLAGRGLVGVDRRGDTVARRGAAGKGGGIACPRSFWRDGWLARLSFAAKYFYFISIAETEGSPFYPWWSLSIREIGKKYGCDASIRRGALELERAGVLEILRGVPKRRGRHYSEEAQYYRLNPLRAALKTSAPALPPRFRSVRFILKL